MIKDQLNNVAEHSPIFANVMAILYLMVFIAFIIAAIRLLILYIFDEYRN